MESRFIGTENISKNEAESEYPLKPNLKSLGRKLLNNSMMEKKPSLQKKITMNDSNLLNSEKKTIASKLKLVDKKDVEWLKCKIKLAVRILENEMNTVLFKAEEVSMYDFINSLVEFFEGR